MSYKGSVSRIEKLSRFVLLLVMLTLAGFLSALGNKILGDMDEWVASPERESFQDKAAIDAASLVAARILRQEEELNEILNTYQKSLDKAEQQYQSEKQSYSDWLQARSAIGSSQEDSEVRDRAKALDTFRQIQASWRGKIDEIDSQTSSIASKKSLAVKKIRELEEIAETKYVAAKESYALKVFFIRLSFVLPILGLGIFFFIRFRSNRFWPLTWGYILFSLYWFFVGLLPYLPSFGGYIRLAVGVLLTLFIGHTVVRQVGNYVKKKREELEVSATERANKISEDVAVRAYKSHSCPSCENDFFLNKWYPKAKSAGVIRTIDEAPDHCTYCGLPLFGECPTCAQRNFLHFPFCSACGNTLTEPSK